MIKINKIKIEYLKTDELIPYINNPRENDNAVDAVASSIKNFGFKNPIVIDGENEIINGHTRLKAAKKLGMKEVPTIRATDLTEEQIRAFRIADNKVSEIAEWNFELLESELSLIENIDMEELNVFSVDLSDIEFSDLDFLTDEDRVQKEKEPITCPHCGELIE